MLDERTVVDPGPGREFEVEGIPWKLPESSGQGRRLFKVLREVKVADVTVGMTEILVVKVFGIAVGLAVGFLFPVLQNIVGIPDEHRQGESGQQEQACQLMICGANCQIFSW